MLFDVLPRPQINGLIQGVALSKRIKETDLDHFTQCRHFEVGWNGNVAYRDPTLTIEQPQFDTAFIVDLGDKRSVELRLLNGKGWIPCGNVTIPPNFKVPALGEVVEVRFLYAFRESNALYQPVYLGPRQDIEQHECVLSQLKYKGTGEEDLC